MAVSKYYRAILDTLQGETDELRPLPRERLDWAGPGALLEFFQKTSGKNRTEMVRAFGRVIHDHPAPPAVSAQLVNLASSLDWAEVEPEVRKLQGEPFAEEEPLRGAITNYLAFRELTAHPPPGKRPRSGALRRNTKPRRTRPVAAVRAQTAQAQTGPQRRNARRLTG